MAFCLPRDTPEAARLPWAFGVFVRVCLPIPELRRAVGGRAACARVPAARGSLRVSREPPRFPSSGRVVGGNARHNNASVQRNPAGELLHLAPRERGCRKNVSVDASVPQGWEELAWV